MKRISPTITFTVSPEVDAKLKRYMEAVGSTNKSKCINKALETGIDTLEAIGWDKSRELAQRMASNHSAQLKTETQSVAPLTPLPNPKQSLAQ